MITTLTGSNSYALQTEADRLVSGFLLECGDMTLEKHDGEEVEFDRIRESLESLPFLSSKKMVVLRTPSVNKIFVDHAEKLLTALPETTDVIIIEPKLDRRLSYYKFLRKNTEFKEFSELDESSLAAWLVSQAKEMKSSLSHNDATYLIERLGGNQQMLANELTKLAIYDQTITRQTIDLLTVSTPQSTIFELLEAAFAGKTRLALKLYSEQRALKVEPQQIIAMLAWQLHILALIKAADTRSSEDIAKNAKLNPYVVRKSQAIAYSLKFSELKQLIYEVMELDIRLKSQSIDADDALQTLLIQISQK